MKKNRIPWMLIAIALAFTFNPNIAIIDPLPDFIGYMILSFALGRLSVLSDTLDEAKHAFEKIMIVDGGKLLTIIWIFGIEALSERGTSMLVWCFVFAVLEGIFLIPAYLKLFKGLSELGDFYPSSSIHQKALRSRSSYTEKIRNLTVAFVCFRAFMTVLPELSTLSGTSDFDGTSTGSLYRYIGVMRGLCFIPVLVFGIIWLVKLIKYFKRLSFDSELNRALCESYAEKERNRGGIFVKKHIKTACWFMLIGAVLTLDIRMEEVNMLPDVFVIALFIPALVYFGKTAKIKMGGIKIFMPLYAVASVISYLLEAYYIENYTYNAMNKDATAFLVYFASMVSVAIQGIMFICLLSAIFKEIKTVIAQHTGYVQGKELHDEGSQERITDVHKELNKNFVYAFDFAMLYVISDVVYSLYGAFYAFANVNLGFLNLVNLGFGLLFVGMMAKALHEMREAVEIKYMLE